MITKPSADVKPIPGRKAIMNKWIVWARMIIFVKNRILENNLSGVGTSTKSNVPQKIDHVRRKVFVYARTRIVRSVFSLRFEFELIPIFTGCLNQRACTLRNRTQKIDLLLIFLRMHENLLSFLRLGRVVFFVLL